MVRRKQQQQNSCILGDRILKNYNFLKKLYRSKSEFGRLRLLRQANSDELLSLVEICTNIVHPSRFCLNDRARQKLSPFASTIRKLGRKRSESTTRSFVVQQQQGNGPLFLALLAPVLAEATRHLIASSTAA